MTAAEKPRPGPDDPPALRTALALLAKGLRPIPLHQVGDEIKQRDGSTKNATGKEPIGKVWGKRKHDEATLRGEFARRPRAGVGLLLGKAGDVVDFEVDDAEAGEATLSDLFGGEVIETVGWVSDRGRHVICRWTPRLAKYKAIVKGDWLPGVELRFGNSADEGQQLQSVCPPTCTAGGQPRRWNGCSEIAEIPEAVFDYLDRHMPKGGPKPVKPVILKFTGPKPAGSWDAEPVMEACRPHIRALAAEWGVEFTGATFDGEWAECRAIDREDRNPSAGVNLESGVYHDFGSDLPALSFFSLAIALGAFPDFSTAVNVLGQRFGVPRPDQYRVEPRVYVGSRRAAEKPDEPDAEEEPEQPAEPDPLDLDATAADLIRLNSTVRWVWQDWIPLGVLTILAAEPGVGKTRFCADLLKRAHLGLPWPDGTPMTCPDGSVALWVPADNQHPEIGTFPDQYGFPAEALFLNATRRNPFVGTMLDAPDDLKDFEARIARIKPAFVFIDTSLNATDRSAHKPEDAKAFFKPLQEIAGRCQTAIVCVTHLNAGGKPLGRRITGQGRVVIQLERPDPDGQPNRRKLWVTKTMAMTPPALGVTMGAGGNEYDLDPPVAPDPDEDKAPGPGGRNGRKPSRLLECCAWLEAQLEDGPKALGDIRKAVLEAGFSLETLVNARRKLRVHEFEVEGLKWIELTEDIPPF